MIFRPGMPRRFTQPGRVPCHRLETAAFDLPDLLPEVARLQQWFKFLDGNRFAEQEALDHCGAILRRNRY